MADMNHKDDVVAIETEEIMLNNHFGDQNDVANENESEIVEMAEHQVPTNQPNGQMEDDVVIDLKALLLDGKEPPLSTSCCIHEVHFAIYNQNTEAYRPKVVSIGPFYHGSRQYQNLEVHKQIYFKQFIERAQLSTILDGLVSFVKNSERRIRACYFKNIKLSQKEFVKVILVDAIFIIELFLRKCFCKNMFEDDAILQNPWFMDTIEVDLLLFENQIPFFILEEIFNICQRLPSFLQLTLDFFWYYNTQDLKPSNLSVPIKHFTDLLRTFHVQPGIVKRGKQSFKDARSRNLFYSACELSEAGVKLKANKGKCLLNLKFSRRVLEIPQILVDDSTEILFRNIIAFEQYHYPLESYIIGYLFLLDNLINTSKDVDVLVHNDIIINNLGDSNDVAKLFNGLCKDILRLHIVHDYEVICGRLNEFCRDPWNKKKAILRRDYCRTPWQTAASIAAIVLIILTIVQTLCSIVQVL